MLDICIPTCCEVDILCLDHLLYSLDVFADLGSCNLIISHNSGKRTLLNRIRETCDKYPKRSLHIDSFISKEPTAHQHGEALNRLIAQSTSEHIVLMDSDVIITSPRWRTFCEDNIPGRFMIGTPYAQPQHMWQGDLPNSWCTFIDGHELRSAGLDMRSNAVWGKSGKKHTWIMPDFWGERKDVSWELGLHAKNRSLDCISLPFNGNKAASQRRSHYAGQRIFLAAGKSELAAHVGKHTGRLRGSRANRTLRNSGKNVGANLTNLHPLEFRLPSTNEICCLHLYGITRNPDRARRWDSCAKEIVDVCRQIEIVEGN